MYKNIILISSKYPVDGNSGVGRIWRFCKKLLNSSRDGKWNATNEKLCNSLIDHKLLSRTRISIVVADCNTVLNNKYYYYNSQ